MLALFHSQTWQIVVLYLPCGIGAGLTLTALPTLLRDLVPAHEMATANGINTVARTIGGVVGTQLTAAILATATVTGTGIPSESAFTIAFWTAAILAGATCAATVFFASTRPSRAS